MSRDKDVAENGVRIRSLHYTIAVSIAADEVDGEEPTRAGGNRSEEDRQDRQPREPKTTAHFLASLFTGFGHVSST